MLLSIKIFFLAMLFVVTGGAIFRSLFRRNRTLALFSGAITLIVSYYLGESVYNDLRGGSTQSVNSDTSATYITQAPSELLESLGPGLEVETTNISIGGTHGDWQYTRENDYALLRHESIRFDLLLRFLAYDTPSVDVYWTGGSSWHVVIGQDIDGKESSYFVNLESGEAFYSRNDAREIFWSPSGQYIVSLCGGEVDYFEIFDTETELFNRTDGLQNDDRLIFVDSVPQWAQGEDFFLIRVSETTNPRIIDTLGRLDSLDSHLARVDTPSLGVALLTD